MGGLRRTGLLAIGIAVLAAGYVLVFATPTVPAGAAQVPRARTTMTGPIPPDMGTQDGAELPAVSPFEQQCLPRIEQPAGWAQLCWEAYRVPADADPQKDYYRLHVKGSYASQDALGIRWFTVASRLVGEPAYNVYDGWPSGTYEGPCRPETVDLLLVAATGPETVDMCGHTTAGPGEGGLWQSTWTCSPCRPFDTTTRAFDLVNIVAVKPGEIPAWDIFADFGT